jgi:hypothetical protein
VETLNKLHYFLGSDWKKYIYIDPSLQTKHPAINWHFTLWPDFLTELDISSIIFWNVMPCILVNSTSASHKPVSYIHSDSSDRYCVLLACIFERCRVRIPSRTN